ncbi:MAG TPA: TonB family protein [Pyrinomonadaceae bacterium]|nr:TonB family protein [Pyrinomonadaceae bacterium]
MKPQSNVLAIGRGVTAWVPHSRSNNQPLTKAPAYQILICLLTFFGLANAQQALPQYSGLTGHCDGTIYKGGEIPGENRAKIRNRTVPNMNQQALIAGVSGTVVIEAVLCRDGRVTDLEVLQDLPEGLTQEAIRAVLAIEFIPAEVKLHSVSQKMRFEFSFNELSGVINPRQAEGKLIRSIEIVGHRRLTTNYILGLIKTKVGDTYAEGQIKQDLESLLSSGYFDPRGTSVRTDAFPDDALTVIFEVKELPLISKVAFEGLERIPESEILGVIKSQNVDLRPGAMYDPNKIKLATSLIKNVLEQRGQQNVSVEIRTEAISFDYVFLTFLIGHQ